MPGRLEGRVALVTGGSRGIGRATALKLGAEGAAVAVNYAASEDAARQVVDAILAASGRARAWQADVSDRAAVDAMVAGVVSEFGRIDILVNNAGIGSSATALTMKDEQIDRLMAVNLKGPVYCVQAAAPSMIEQGGGAIVNVVSVAGIGTALPGTTAYAASKAALIALTKRMALDLGRHGIRVNAVAPGHILTDMSGNPDQERLAAMAGRAILGRVGRPEDVATTIAFLACEDSAFVTGQCLAVDGGRMDYLSHSM
jgi:3-oxoacyl-[acyl-carrier protein] reductase